MSLLLTKSCHYAILVAIEDGKQFKAQKDADIYIKSRLNIELPSPVDDLIPPNTRISTKPIKFTQEPKWRTTLVYYLSDKILSRLKNSHAILDVCSLSEPCTEEGLGSVILNMKNAKSVRMRNGSRNISQIQQFVVDKGDWIPIKKKDDTVTGKIKAGLFIVEMPRNADSNLSGNKEVGTPLQIPMRFNASSKNNIGELGLEICSDMSDLFIDSNDQDEQEQQQQEEEEEESILDYQEAEEECIDIGSGTDKYGFLFRVIQAKHISSILNHYPDIEEAYIYYQFGNREYKCVIEPDQDGWSATKYHSNVLLQGDLQEIKDWLSEQISMEIYIVVKQSKQCEDIIVCKSQVYLKERDIGITQQSSIIYDTDETWHINSEKQFAQLQFQIGLVEGWETVETDIHVPIQNYPYKNQDGTFDDDNEVF